jgi:hypothetical protein
MAEMVVDEFYFKFFRDFKYEDNRLKINKNQMIPQ